MGSKSKADSKGSHGKPQKYSPEKFLSVTLEPEGKGDIFSVFEKRLVRIQVDGVMWIKRGAAVAYHGDLRFRREHVFQKERLGLKSGPLRSALKREMVRLSRVEGKGTLYVSDEGKQNQVIRLENGTVYVAGSNLLAFEPSLAHEVRMVGGAGVLAGGIFVIKLTGSGFVAISTKGVPLTLRVSQDDSISSVPSATVAWTGDLWPKLKTDLEMRSIVMHGGGEPFQMFFTGEGYVVVEAKKEETVTNPVGQITKWFKGLF